MKYLVKYAIFLAALIASTSSSNAMVWDLPAGQEDEKKVIQDAKEFIAMVPHEQVFPYSRYKKIVVSLNAFWPKSAQELIDLHATMLGKLAEMGIDMDAKTAKEMIINAGQSLAELKAPKAPYTPELDDAQELLKERIGIVNASIILFSKTASTSELNDIINTLTKMAEKPVRSKDIKLINKRLAYAYNRLIKAYEKEGKKDFAQAKAIDAQKAIKAMGNNLDTNSSGYKALLKTLNEYGIK
ncbi:hypothetical protein HYX58_00835 [Candidatus Dependentiae bacterium]|nr:hypothetical protein [Candidatus Dependentiae bacterium]